MKKIKIGTTVVSLRNEGDYITEGKKYKVITTSHPSTTVTEPVVQVLNKNGNVWWIFAEYVREVSIKNVIGGELI